MQIRFGAGHLLRKMADQALRCTPFGEPSSSCATIDIQSFNTGVRERSLERFEEHFRSKKFDLGIVLIGNHHAMRLARDFQKAMAGHAEKASYSQQATQLKVFQMMYAGGSAWNCRTNGGLQCGAHVLGAQNMTRFSDRQVVDGADVRTLHDFRNLQNSSAFLGDFDGVYWLRSVTASRPFDALMAEVLEVR